MDKAFFQNFLHLCLAKNMPLMLESSFKDYHVRGFNSIILTRSEPLTMRLYVCMPGETDLHADNDNLLVHNHQFDFQTQVLVGHMENVVYAQTAGLNPEQQWHQYRYESALKSSTQTINLEYVGQTGLRLVRWQRIEAGGSYYLQHHELHRIFVPSDCLVAMLFWQHQKVNNTPWVFSRVPQPAILPADGLYHRFSSKQEICDLINLVIDNL